MELHIVIQGRKDLANQLYEQLRENIESGRLAAGVQLPPSRLLAEQLGLSRKTISDTYSRLTYENYLVGKIGSGTFVNALNAPPQRRQTTSELASATRVKKMAGHLTAAAPPDAGRHAALRLYRRRDSQDSIPP